MELYRILITINWTKPIISIDFEQIYCIPTPFPCSNLQIFVLPMCMEMAGTEYCGWRTSVTTVKNGVIPYSYHYKLNKANGFHRLVTNILNFHPFSIRTLQDFALWFAHRNGYIAWDIVAREHRSQPSRMELNRILLPLNWTQQIISIDFEQIYYIPTPFPCSKFQVFVSPIV